MVLAGFVASSLALGSDSKKPNKPKRPELPWGVTGLNPIQTGSYDSKAQAPAETVTALTEMTLRGWDMIRKYYPQLGVKPDEETTGVIPRKGADHRISAPFANEDPGRSPIPLISMICSLDASDATGRLKALRDEFLPGIQTDDYAKWSVEQLRSSVRKLTQEATSLKGVKYRAPKKPLTFHETVELYAMTVELIARDDKWDKWQQEVKKIGYGIPALPDLPDFSKRLSHQLPVLIPPGATRGFLLYRAGWDVGEPVSKQEYAERMDVVLVKRSGATFQVEQFPIYLTNDQAAWNPAWIEMRDEVRDTTLNARKFEMQWTRFDGPYLWPKRDQLNGPATYRATVHFTKGEIVIEGEHIVPRRGAVVKTARDANYEPLNMQSFGGGEELAQAALTADLPELPDWQAMRRTASADITTAVHAQGDRQLFWYRTGEGAWSSSVYLRSDAGLFVLRPNQPVTAPAGGIVPRFVGTGVERPEEVEVLDKEQRTSVKIAVALMNRCLANAGGAELSEIRVALPRDAENQTPFFFYAVRNGTSVRRSPTFVAVVLSAGYYNSYVSVFNRLLWVLGKPIAEDPAKVAALQQAIADYLRNGFPKDGEGSNDPTLIAWAQILRDNQVDQLFTASILPGAVKPEAVSAAAVAPELLSPPVGTAGDWLRSSRESAGLSDEAEKNAEIALGLLNQYLAVAPDSGVQQWKKWYRQGTMISFRAIPGTDPASAKEEVVEVTSEAGEKRSAAKVVVELASPVYGDYTETLVWMLGVMEANARSRSADSSGLFAGQGSGTEAVLAYYRQLNLNTDLSSAWALAHLGVDSRKFRAAIPDIPTMFLGTGSQPGGAPSASSMPPKPKDGAERPVIAAHYPSDVGQGEIDLDEQFLLNDAVRVMNLYYAKPEEKRDRAAEDFRKTLPLISNLYVYRNSIEAIHGKPGDASALYVGLAALYDTRAKWFVQLLRVLEMQNTDLIESPATREGIARSIHDFLQSYAKAYPVDLAAVELSAIDIEVMTELR